MLTDPPGAALEYGVSCDTRFRAEITVELAEQGIAIAFSPVGKMRDKVLDLLTRGLAQTLHAAEVGRIGLDEGGVELMLANQLAESVANGAPAIVAVAIGGLWEFSGVASRAGLSGKRSDLLD